jgi:hypothetical protein
MYNSHVIVFYIKNKVIFKKIAISSLLREVSISNLMRLHIMM